MGKSIGDLTKQVASVETKLDGWSASVDRRFDEVLAAIVEQREHTEFAFTRLETKIDSGFRRLEKLESGFSRVERKLDQFIDVQLQANRLVEGRLRALEEPGRQGSTGLS